MKSTSLMTLILFLAVGCASVDLNTEGSERGVASNGHDIEKQMAADSQGQ